MKYSSAISAAVKGELGPRKAKLVPLHQCERCKCYDEINTKQRYEWLKPFNGYVQTPLCWVCISELRMELRRK